MELPITYRVEMKAKLAVEIVCYGSKSSDTGDLRRAASLLAHMAQAIDTWKAAQGSPGTPMPAPTDAQLAEMR